MNTETVKENIRRSLEREGYQVHEELPYEGVNGKFTFYALQERTGKEKLIRVRDFTGATNAATLQASLDEMATVQTKIELQTIGRRDGKKQPLDLMLVGVNVHPNAGYEFVRDPRHTEALYNPDGVLRAGYQMEVNGLKKTGRFQLTF
jgi:hypothetical protein